ncbi:hypothetical protein BDV93DRAFT_595430 [Ceratobasidium sp. AG-I]|nr:hypothetical protein BDV93DRAFT_595430 [Ceratobasidium sp. AG-I]
MPLSKTLSAELSHLKKRLGDFENEYESRDKRADDGGPDSAILITVLKDTCALIRQAESSNSVHLTELVEAAQDILSEGVYFAYSDEDLFDFLPSWAHDDERGEPLIKDRGETDMPYLCDNETKLIDVLLSAQGAVASMLAVFKRTPMPPTPKLVADPWNESMKRHPKTSLLARFRPGLPTLTATPANPLAMCIYDARCEVTSSGINSPIELQLTRANSCLAMNAMGGYKDRSPVLSYFFLNEGTSGLPDEYFLEVGLESTAYAMALDESRNLIFLGDRGRVKSYAWGAPGGDNYDEPLATHTLKSGRADGPITTLPNGTIVRAGKGKASVWKLDELQTHGEDGTALIGEEIDLEESWRDDPDEIEQSSGTKPTSQLTFADNPSLKPAEWHPLTQSPSSMLCTTSETGSTGSKYDCFVLDLEHGGKIAARFLGHGGNISNFSVSTPDPQVFLTSCSDGFARMYDIRRPLPVLTFDACGQHDFCKAVALAHPDGIPTVFTGSGKAEQIKVWDVRACTPIYELATGNNRVTSLVWDSGYNSLYAATETSHMDRLGTHHGYRPTKAPTQAQRSQLGGNVDEDEDMGEDEDEDMDNDYYDDNCRCWPEDAMHNEHYFGYAFDAGEHRIYRYRFKEDSSSLILPDYGDARMGGTFW